MAKRKLLIEFDPATIFDKIAAMNGNYRPLGDRMVELLLGDPDWKNALALDAAYDVSVAKIEPNTIPVPTSRQEAEAMLALGHAYIAGLGPDGKSVKG